MFRFLWNFKISSLGFFVSSRKNAIVGECYPASFWKKANVTTYRLHVSLFTSVRLLIKDINNKYGMVKYYCFKENKHVLKESKTWNIISCTVPGKQSRIKQCFYVLSWTFFINISKCSSTHRTLSQKYIILYSKHYYSIFIDVYK